MKQFSMPAISRKRLLILAILSLSFAYINAFPPIEMPEIASKVAFAFALTGSIISLSCSDAIQSGKHTSMGISTAIVSAAGIALCIYALSGASFNIYTALHRL